LVEKYSLKEKIHYIANAGNVGVAEGNNQGILSAIQNKCDYIILLNNDIEFDNSQFFQTLVTVALRQNEDIIVPKIFIHGTDKIWMAGGKLDLKKGLTIHIGEGEVDNSNFDVPCYTDYAPTCFMLISKKVFESSGLMDSNYFVYYDDTDFILRATAKGFKILYLPDLAVFHKVSNSTGVFSSTYIYYYNRNRLYFILKNLSSFRLIQALYYYTGSRILSFFKMSSVQRKVQLKGIIDGIKLCFRKRKIKYI
jgi:GT2 family glycosyltransferase